MGEYRVVVVTGDSNEGRVVCGLGTEQQARQHYTWARDNPLMRGRRPRLSLERRTQVGWAEVESIHLAPTG